MIASLRLDLVATTLAHLEVELATPERLGDMIGATVPPDWPPGQYDRDAMLFFRDRMAEGGEAVVGWYGWYAIARAADGEPARLVGAGGYFGPPSPEGWVEIGYSIATVFRNRGYATELAAALTVRALSTPGVKGVAAETHAENAASIIVLERCGFTRVGAGREPGQLRFERVGTRGGATDSQRPSS